MTLDLANQACVLGVYNNGLFWLHCPEPTTPVIADEYCYGHTPCNIYNCSTPSCVAYEWRSTFDSMFV